MGRHTINVDYNKFTVNLGERTVYIRHNSKLDSISIDCKRDGTTICLSGNWNESASVCMFTIKDYSFKELAELIFDLINLKKPEKLYLEKLGMSIGIRDYLISNLSKNKIALSKSGKLIYDLDNI